MKDYGRIRSTVRPDGMEIDEYSVSINTDVEEIDLVIDGETHTEYEFNRKQYTKDEYIKRMNENLGTNKVNALIRERYTVADEFALSRQREEKPDEWQEYYEFCEECKRMAREE